MDHRYEIEPLGRKAALYVGDESASEEKLREFAEKRAPSKLDKK